MSLALCSDRKESAIEKIEKKELKENKQGSKMSKRSIVFLGDSLTAGYGLQSSQGPVSLIAVKIEKSGLDYRVINAGRSGDTSAGGLARIEWYLQKELKVRHLVIGLGSNDAMRGLAIKEIEKNIKAIIKKARASEASIKIYVWQLFTFPNMSPSYAKKFARIFPRLASSEKVILLPFPLKGIAAKKEMNQADGIHPNVEGARILAENLWRSMKSHL